jgi:hypothetical protein
MWPGTPQLRLMSAGATDGAYLTPVGIPTYGISGDFGEMVWTPPTLKGE